MFIAGPIVNADTVTVPPTICGGGLLHSLLLSRVPPSHEALHEVHGVHSDHPPSTGSAV